MWKETVMSMSGIYEGTFLEDGEDRDYLDLTGLPGTNFFCSDEAAAQIRQRLDKRSFSGLHWIDSGDYHYLSLFWLEKIREPFTLLMMDHHADMQESVFGSGLLSCGSWVRRGLERLSLMKKVILIGAEEGGSGDTWESYRERILHFPENCLDAGRDALAEALARLPVYISFDKDLLAPDVVRTGWSQGGMTEEKALDVVSLAFRQSHILGIDLCGELPISGAGAGRGDAARNEALNIRLRAALSALSASQA